MSSPEEEEIDRESFAARIDEKVDHFLGLLEDVDLEAPKTVGDWSLRDMLAHLVAWHEECLWAIRSTIEGNYERRDYTDVNGWNASALTRYAGVDGAALLEKARASGHEIAKNVREIPEELWVAKRRLRTWPHASTIGHYEEHEPDVKQAISRETK